MLATRDENYRAYLLRFWRDDAWSPWRILLVDSHTGEQRSFASPAEAYAFLNGQLVDNIDELDATSTDKCR